MDHLLTIRHEEKESLRWYVKCFTRNVLEVDEADDKVQLTTFKVGLKFREFVVMLVKSPPKAMINMLLKAQKYINAKDAQAAIGEESTPKEKENAREDQRGCKRERRDR